MSALLSNLPTCWYPWICWNPHPRPGECPLWGGYRCEEGLLSGSTPWFSHQHFSCADLIYFCLWCCCSQLKRPTVADTISSALPWVCAEIPAEKSIVFPQKTARQGLGLGTRTCLHWLHWPVLARAKGWDIWELVSFQSCWDKTYGQAACLVFLHCPFNFCSMCKKNSQQTFWKVHWLSNHKPSCCLGACHVWA